jgi:hypothetical protein
MKKQIILLVTLFVSVSVFSQINMNSGGNVGIGISPDGNKLRIAGSSYTTGTAGFQSDVNFLPSGASHPLKITHVSVYMGWAALLYPLTNNMNKIGLIDKAFDEVYSYGFTNPSDARLKENIKDIPNALDLVLQLKGVKYDLKKECVYIDTIDYDEETIQKLEAKRKNKIGFIAQDVYKILPEIVSYDDSIDLYGIQYDKIVPVLVEAIKEQQTIIESMQAELQTIKFKSTQDQTEPGQLDRNTQALLYQNSPNPFSTSTKIEYYVLENTKEAMINVYDMNGTQLKSIPLHLTGYGNITINGNELKAGMYFYTLIADGQIIDTKRMILTN